MFVDWSIQKIVCGLKKNHLSVLTQKSRVSKNGPLELSILNTNWNELFVNEITLGLLKVKFQIVTNIQEILEGKYGFKTSHFHRTFGVFFLNSSQSGGVSYTKIDHTHLE